LSDARMRSRRMLLLLLPLMMMMMMMMMRRRCGNEFEWRLVREIKKIN